jgi:hypothetical protein
MFFVRDPVPSRREKIIRMMNEGEPSIALLLAVIDLERTLRRAILALGCSRTKELNAQMGVTKGKDEKRKVNSDPKKGPIRYRSNIEGLHEAWKVEVQPRLHRRLPGDLAPHWSDVRKACDLRNELVHGAHGPTTKDFAQFRVSAVLELIENLYKLAQSEGHDLQKPVRRRLKDCLP